MKNWKDYVGYGESVTDIDGWIPVHYLTVNYENETDPNTKIGFSIERKKVKIEEFTLTEEEVAQEVERLLTSFPEVIVKNQFDITRYKNKIALNTRRGAGNTEIKILNEAVNRSVVFYNGSNRYDRPIQVEKFNDKYYVLKHPKFELYGFNTRDEIDEGSGLV